ncbi:TonB-dependent siderophore receptor [Pseudothauera nasutitermitis]|uniref:TonB-dependent siderophore receptor n=1 Tax=Pseudothauera nasutitermitis TaxID=2565930 RepID=A0A4S4B2T1_9RHOO|nr:TonB-dependent siderophore receptor [Pseudothauera nasutitermitis]THF66950.1 TonB-dependent siderophore receptor [Pseudothauera nasutitermitis]
MHPLPSRRERGPRVRLLPFALALALGCGALATAPGALAQPAESSAALFQYDIPAGPLGDTLTRIARESGRGISVAPELLAGRSAPALRGHYSAEEAARLALAGSGLELVVTPSGALSVRQGETSLAPVNVSATLLAELRVTASAERSATSEGSGSYAARAATIGKTAQTLREIPQSVSVITRQRMDDQQLTSVTSALRTATGVISTGYYDQEAPSARGFNMNEQHDGVPQQGGSSGLAPDLAIYDRIEILRGSSGLLSGSGEPGGAVNYVRKRPQAEFGVGAALAAGSWNNRRATVDVNVPLSEDGSFRGRVVGAYQERDFFYDVAHNRRSTTFITLEYDLTPRTTIGASHTYVKRDGHAFWGLPTYTDGSFVKSRSAFVGPDTGYLMKVEESSVDIRHRFDNGWEAKGALSKRAHRFDGYGAYNNTGGVDRATGLGGLAIGLIQSTTRRDGADISVSGPVELFGRSHVLAFGYNKAIQDYTGGANYVSAGNVDLFNDHDFDALLPTRVINKSQTVTEQSGYYGMARIKLADPLTLVLGGRWTDYESKSRAVRPAKAAWTRSKAEADGEFTPYGGLIWDFSRAISLYASYTDIFVPQTQMDVGGKVLDPRVGWQGEVGVKGEFFDGALNASLAAFRIRDKNRAMTDTTHIGCGGTSTGTCYTAAGLVQSQGWEAEVSGSPAPGWDLSAGYTYNQTEYLRDTSAANVGERFNSATPRHLLKLWAHYRFDHRPFDGALAGWSVGAGLRAQSGIYFGTSTATVKRREQPGYAVAALQVGYRANRHWNATLAVNNLFDRRYFELVSGTGFANIYGEPRNVMLTLEYKL